MERSSKNGSTYQAAASPFSRNTTPSKRAKRISSLTVVVLIVALVSAGGLAPAFNAPALAQTGATWTHTTVADFSGCGMDNGASVTNMAGGEVRLPALVEDYFDGSTLDTTLWIGDDPLSVGGGILTLGTSSGSCSIRSIASIDEGDLPVAVEGRIRFVEPGVGSYWADFGLGKPDQVSGPPNALFISDSESNVYANDYQPGDSGPWRTEITGIDWDEYQEVRFELYSDWVDYYVNGEWEVGHYIETPLTMPMYLWLFNLNYGSAFPVRADWIRLARYPAEDEYISCPVNAGSSVTWGVLSWQGALPTGTDASFLTRTSDDGVSWSAWVPLGTSGAIASPAGRYLQYRIDLSTDDRTLSPQVDEVLITAGDIDNDPPVAYGQAVGTDEDTSVGITLTASDPDDDPLTYSVLSGPANGTLTGSAPALTYTPDANYDGSDSFTFRASDGIYNSNIATVNITVDPVNDAPVASNQDVSTDQSTPVDITLVASDVDGDPLTYSVVDGPANGTLSGSGPDLTYTPDSGYSGSDSFTFRANDGTANSNLATVDITVTPVAGAPVAEDDTVSTGEDSPVTIDVLSNDTDPQGEPLSVASVDTPNVGTATTDGTTVTYTPENRSAPYAAVFNYTVTDGGQVDTGTVTVSVSADNDPPDAVNDTAATAEENPIILNVLSNDSDPDADDTLSVASVGTPNVGTATTDGTTVTYTPENRSTGYVATFNYTASDGDQTDTATVSVTVSAGNDPPYAVDDTGTTNEDTPLTLDVLSNDSDPDADQTLSISFVGIPDVGTTTTDGATVIYAPANRAAPYTAVFNYMVTDGDWTDTATVTIYVDADNDPPTLSDIPDLTVSEDTVFVLIPFTVADMDTPAGSLALSAQSSNTALVPNSSISFSGAGSQRSLIVTPAAGQTGSTTITVTASDGERTSSETFVLTVGSWTVYLPLVLGPAP